MEDFVTNFVLKKTKYTLKKITYNNLYKLYREVAT